MNEKFVNALGVENMATGQLSDNGGSMMKSDEANVTVWLIVGRCCVGRTVNAEALAPHAP